MTMTLAFLATVSVVTASSVPHQQLWRAVAPNSEVFGKLRAETGSFATGIAEIATERFSEDEEFEVLVVDAAKAAERLAASNFTWSIAALDFEAEVVAPERARLAAFRELPRTTRAADWDLEFHNLTEINEWMAGLAAAHPDIATQFSLPYESYEGRPINGIKLHSGPAGDDKPSIFFNAAVHAREWITPATIMYVVREMVEGFDTGDADVTAMLRDFSWHIVPVLNVDGFVYTFNGNRLHRKTRSPPDGVDGNRNLDSNFGGVGSSPLQFSDTYHGPEAFSESEIRAVRDYVNTLPNLKAYVDWHANGKILTCPSAYTRDLPEDYDCLQAIQSACGAKVGEVNGNNFPAGTWYTTMYPSSGVLQDYFYEVNRGLVYSGTWELGGTGFTPPPSFIVTSGAEWWAGVQELHAQLSSPPSAC